MQQSRLDKRTAGSQSRAVRAGAGKCVVHLYALCWNEERLLPFFFHNYDSIVTQYFIFDHDSTDRSREILTAHPCLSLGKFNVRDDSYVSSAWDFYNHAWKQSRSHADWIVICNIDEHLEHPQLAQLLVQARKSGATIFASEGYEMITANFPAGNAPLRKQTRRGWLSQVLDKVSIFNPTTLARLKVASSGGRNAATHRRISRTPTSGRHQPEFCSSL